jgi:hypothetical protein
MKKETSITMENKVNMMKSGTFKLSMFKDIVIDIDDNHKNLTKLFIGKKLSTITERILLLQDYNDRCFDLCGSYFSNPFYDTPN